MIFLVWLLQYGQLLAARPLDPTVPSLPPLHALEQIALRKLGADQWDYGGARDRLRQRHWLPTVAVRVSGSSWDRASLTDDVASVDSRRTGYGGEVALTWHLSALAYDDHEIALMREHLHVQREVAATLARVRADVAAYRALVDVARAGDPEARAQLVALRTALLEGHSDAR